MISIALIICATILTAKDKSDFSSIGPLIFLTLCFDLAIFISLSK